MICFAQCSGFGGEALALRLNNTTGIRSTFRSICQYYADGDTLCLVAILYVASSSMPNRVWGDVASARFGEGVASRCGGPMGEPSGAGAPGSGESMNESYSDLPGGMSPEPFDGSPSNDALRPGRDMRYFTGSSTAWSYYSY